MTQKQQYIAGLKTAIPLILGFVPVGIAYAIMAQQAGFSFWENVGMSVFVFAGASQMMAVGMHAQGAGLLAIVFATFILNLRHLIMSTYVMNHLRGDSIKTKLITAFGITDEGFAVFATEKKQNQTSAFLLGLITITFISWVGGTILGAVAATFLPAILSASLGISLYTMFLALLVPNVRKNAKLGLLVIFTAIVNTLLCRIMASSWALIASTLLCAWVGSLFVDLKQQEEKADEN